MTTHNDDAVREVQEPRCEVCRGPVGPSSLAKAKATDAPLLCARHRDSAVTIGDLRKEVYELKQEREKLRDLIEHVLAVVDLSGNDRRAIRRDAGLDA